MTDETPATILDESHPDENRLIAERRAKLAALRAQGIAFPNDFRRTDHAGDLQQQYAEADKWTGEALEGEGRRVALAGRLLAKRVMGKAAFAQVQDVSGRIQLFLQSTALGDAYEAFKGWDVGDIVAATGTLMRTRTGELSVKADSLRLLVKSLRPLPDKWHGLSDVEQRYRQRYVDLIVTPEAREVFIKRSQVIGAMRRWLDARRFLEVETPMMHYLAGGATASRSPPTTTRSTWTCSCAWRPSCTSSAWWSAGSSGCTRSTATSATRASVPATTPSSPCSSCTRPMPATTRSWT